MNNLDGKIASIQADIDHVRGLVDEARESRDGDPMGSLNKARIAAEAISRRVCQDLGLTEGKRHLDDLDLSDLIQRIKGSRKVSKLIVTHLHSIRGYGNLGSHDRGVVGKKAVKPEAVGPCLNALAMVTEWFVGEHLPSVDAAVPGGPGEARVIPSDGHGGEPLVASAEGEGDQPEPAEARFHPVGLKLKCPRCGTGCYTEEVYEDHTTELRCRSCAEAFHVDPSGVLQGAQYNCPQCGEQFYSEERWYSRQVELTCPGEDCGIDFTLDEHGPVGGLVGCPFCQGEFYLDWFCVDTDCFHCGKNFTLDGNGDPTGAFTACPQCEKRIWVDNPEELRSGIEARCEDCSFTFGVKPTEQK